MVKLFCALVGEKGNSFPVKIDESESVGDLRTAIKKEKENDLKAVDANKLELFLGKQSNGLWLDSNTDVVQKLNNGEMNAFIEELTHEAKKLQGESALDEVLEGMPVPMNNEIHILVVVPENAVRDITAATPFPIEHVRMVVDEALRAQQQRSVYSISNCPPSKELLMMQHLGLEYSTITVKEVIDRTILNYTWSNLAENHPDQRQLYLEYLEEHLRDALISGGEQIDFLKDVSHNKTLLDCHDSRLPFKLKGTTDVVIVDTYANQIDDVFVGLRFVIELKKDKPNKQDRWQILQQMIVADTMCERRCSPMGLLTNLNDYWLFLWFTQDKKVARMFLACPANAFKVMKQVLEDRNGPTDDEAFPMQFSFLHLPNPLKRRRLLQNASGCNEAAYEMLERYELMSDELSPEFLQQQRIDYALNLVRQMPVHSAMYN
jgi:Crinkler effector protein N-terminal domain